MKVILKRDVKGLGREGDLKEVKERLRAQLPAADRPPPWSPTRAPSRTGSGTRTSARSATAACAPRPRRPPRSFAS